MGETQYKTVLNIAKDKFRSDRKHAIYAVIKGNVTQLTNETFSSVEELRQAKIKYGCQGFKVKYYICV